MAERPPLIAEKLGFFGAVAASLSHELKNVLATINELSGLIEDQSLAAEAGRALRPEQLKRACANIARQVQRGSTLVGRLNQFAHSVDSPAAQVDLGDMLHRICDICDRFASLAQVSLARQISAEPLTLTLDPFALQHAAAIALRAAFAAAEAGQAIALSFAAPAAGGASCRLAIEAAGPLDEAGRAQVQGELMRQLAAELGAELSLETEQGRDRVALTWS